MTSSSLENIANRQRDYFINRPTAELSFRVQQLKILASAIEENEGRILEALRADLGKPEMEAFASEIAPILQEILLASRKLKSWAKPQRVKTPMLSFPGSSYIYAEPYGSVLIIAPWNYPFQLAIAPLVGALAAGNCAVVKPSEIAPHTSKMIAELIGNHFEPAYVAVAEGAVETTQALLAQKFDYIFYTGSTGVGRIIMQAAAKHLTPVTLELGGKSPCIVDQDTDLETTARRIAWGKFFNAGQTCLAPDYLVVHTAVKEGLLEAMKAIVGTFYGGDPAASPDYAKIINRKHFARLTGLLTDADVLIGGTSDPESLYIAPTIVNGVKWTDTIMDDEIFGPILPVLEYQELQAVIAQLHERPKPLALYFFSKNRKRQEKILREVSAGGVNINDTLGHFANQCLPFGGVGDSGIGAYHGKASFDTFTHAKSVFKRSFWADPRLKYPPYKIPLRYFRKIRRLIY